MENRGSDAERLAMAKLREEMAREDARPWIGSVGEVMTDILLTNPAAAPAILTEGKTLAGAYAALEDYAIRNRDNDACRYIGPGRAIQIIAGYYGFNPVAGEGTTQEGGGRYAAGRGWDTEGPAAGGATAR